MTDVSERKKILDSLRFYPEFKEDLGTISDAVGMSKQRIVEDALEYYFGNRARDLIARRESVVAAVQRIRASLKSEQLRELSSASPVPASTAVEKAASTGLAQAVLSLPEQRREADAPTAKTSAPAKAGQKGSTRRQKPPNQAPK